MQFLKNLLKKLLPPPVRTFLREINGLRELISGQGKNMASRLERQEKQLAALAEQQSNGNAKLQFQLQRIQEQNELQLQNQKRIMEELAFQHKYLLKLAEDSAAHGAQLTGLADAMVVHDTQTKELTVTHDAAMKELAASFETQMEEQQQTVRQELDETKETLFVQLRTALQEELVRVSGENTALRERFETLNSEFLRNAASQSEECADLREQMDRTALAIGQCMYILSELYTKTENIDLWTKAHQELPIAGEEDTPQQENPPCVSVLVPVYNVAPYLRQCMDSLVGQTLENIEIICVNDGSTDTSIDILQEYAAKDHRIRIIDKQQNEGLMLARKSGIAAASGQYIMFVDSDDYMDLDACNQAYALIEKYGVDILQFSSGVECHDAEKGKGTVAWLERALVPKGVSLFKEEILNAFFVARSEFTSMYGKIYSTKVCKAAHEHIEKFYSYVGEDIFQFFFFAFFANTYQGVVTQPLYWYRYGLGVSNNQSMEASKFEKYCKMSFLCKRVRSFLEAHGCMERCRPFYEAMVTRMLEDCCRIYVNRIAEGDKKAAGELLLQHWYDHPGADGIAKRIIGRTLSEL